MRRPRPKESCCAARKQEILMYTQHVGAKETAVTDTGKGAEAKILLQPASDSECSCQPPGNPRP